MKSIAYLVFVFTWIAGVVLASGWWKLLAVFMPFYGWYLVVEKALQHIGAV
jgi:hypothetical protein